LAIEQGLTYADLAKIRTAADHCWPIPHRAGPDALRLNRIARAVADFRKNVLMNDS